jgi:co-chaperonin GroES (HSP10)
MMRKKNLIVVGDRVLILPDEKKEQTNHGLFLPQGVEEKEKVQAGTVVRTGPGYPLPDVGGTGDEPWMNDRQTEPKYLPTQAREGDYAIFLRKASVEIEYEGKAYLIVPQAAILVLLRDEVEE